MVSASDIHRLSKDLVPDEPMKCLWSDHLDADPEEPLQSLLQIEPGEHGGMWGERDEQIHIALRTRIAARDRAKDSDICCPVDTGKREDLFSPLGEQATEPGGGIERHWHPSRYVVTQEGHGLGWHPGGARRMAPLAPPTISADACQASGRIGALPE